jgi:hypothetical protein
LSAPACAALTALALAITMLVGRRLPAAETQVVAQV